MAVIREVSILELWLDEKLDKVDALIDGMSVNEIREFEHTLLGLIDHLASREP